MNESEIQALLKENTGKFYCYVLREPNGSPFYVGAGRERRIFQHVKDSRGKQRSRKLSIIRGITKSGDRVNYEIVGFFDEWEKAIEAEKQLIAHYGRKDLGTGVLANLTDGGDGTSGFGPDIISLLSRQKKGVKFSEEHKEALSASWHTPARLAGIASAARKNTGKKQTEEHKKKISVGNKGRPLTSEHRKKIGLAQIGKIIPQESRIKMSLARKAFLAKAA